MLFLKRRAHLRHLAKRPRGATLLNHDRPSNTTSLYSGPDGSGSGSEMAESEFSPGVVSSAATAIAAANLAAIPANGYPAPQPYKRFNADADGPNTSSTSDASPFAQSKPSRSERQGALLVDIETQPSDGVLLSPLPLLPSPHEQSSFGLIDAAAASSSQALNRQSRDLPGLPASTTHADMVAFQKELERDDEKTNQPNGTRTAEDPPPLYSD
ncbi:hypothetical protein FPV67DRAFT_995717 [Lyophyllum atratum]|nr:hypothetical protein FPV67DRAFT_995717 [Lyophyllum atratum]